MFNDYFHRVLSRRDFFKESGRLALVGAATTLSLESILLSGCATFNPKKDWSQVSAKEFNIKAFDRWFRRNKLYNGVNTNLKRPHGAGHYPTFRDCTFSTIGATPGIDYGVPYGEVMVAAAPGEVSQVHEIIGTGRAGGMAVHIAHPDNSFGSITMPYSTHYAHLDRIFVKEGQKVARGQEIGNATEYNNIAKLIFLEGEYGGGDSDNWLDPDNYGFNHSYMGYANGQLRVDEENNANKELMNEKWRKQMTALNQLDRMRTGSVANFLDDYLNDKAHGRRCPWSPVEKFRYLEGLYKVNPRLFPSLSKDQFESMKKEFYDNQPIILTLPFVKGGMKKYK